MELDCRGNQRLISDIDELGQSTVEYVVVMTGFLVVAVGMGAIWHALRDGGFVEHALLSASHHVGGVVAAVVADVFLY